MDIDGFGRELGWRMCARRMRGGVRMLLQPIDFLRYYEFEFVAQALRGMSGDALDVSSPSLFSLWVARRRQLRVRVSNPDIRDSAMTAAMARAGGLAGLEVTDRAVGALAAEGRRYRAIWSISVFEHIHGDQADGAALRALAERLEPGGVLAMTVMTAPRFEDEYVADDVYGLGLPRTERGYFFQRYYDAPAIERRLVDHVPELQLSRCRYFGEMQGGTYAAFVERARKGFSYRWGVEAPRIAVDSYGWFNRFEEMPGVGVCCLEFRNP